MRWDLILKMMKGRGIIGWQVFGMSLVIVAGIILLVLLLFFGRPPRGREREMRIRLLYETDHKALRDACSELSRRARTASLTPGMYQIRSNPNPEVAQFPEIILQLAPAYVEVSDDGMVIVAMMGGLSHFGVVFYPERYAIQNRPLGNKEIASQLWYYDDGYDERSDWQERIDSLRPEPGKAEERGQALE